MRNHVARAFAAAVILSSPAAFAADPLAPEAIYDWSGFYVGAHAGYAGGEVGVSDVDFTIANFPVVPLPFETDYDVDGWLAGVQAGFQAQTGSLVWGLEADISAGDVSGDDGFVETEQKWLATLRGRIGYAFDNILVYGTGGVAFTETETGIPFGSDPTDEQIHTGWTIGAGAELAVTENISLKAEYLYVDFEEENYNVELFTFFVPFGFDGDVDLDQHIGRVGLNYRF